MAEVGKEMIILDQHGAHECILYEKLLKNVRGTPADLPAPIVVQLPAGLAPECGTSRSSSKSWDSGSSSFESDAVRLLAAPEAVTGPEEFLGALEALVGGEDLAKALACQDSTKFGQSLTQEEMAVLLQEWPACEFGAVCPHGGRPIVKRVPLTDLLGEFGRIQPRAPFGRERVSLDLK